MPWIAFNDSFLSIVADSQKPSQLIVRARARGDIERVFPDAKVRCLPARDYAFRAELPRSVVADAVARRVIDTQETNFKDSVKERDRHDAYFRIWSAMADFQRTRGHGYPYQTTATGRARQARALRPGWNGGILDTPDFSPAYREVFGDDDPWDRPPVRARGFAGMTDAEWAAMEREADEHFEPTPTPKRRRRKRRGKG